jgi:hypothetical protein
MREVARSATALNVAEIGAAREHRSVTTEIPRSVLKRFARAQRANLVQAGAIILARGPGLAPRVRKVPPHPARAERVRDCLD